MAGLLDEVTRIAELRATERASTADADPAA
jgi:hypothetical protein